MLGFETDLAAVEVLFTSLLVQVNLAMLAAGRTTVAFGITAMFGDRLVARQPRISDHRSWAAGHAAAHFANLGIGPEIPAAS